MVDRTWQQKAWIGQIDSEGTNLNKSVEEMVDWLDLKTQIPRDARVVIKPNMTYPFYNRGVSTKPEIIEAIVRVLYGISSNITIVESDGGSYAWPAEQAFEGHGINALCRKYGIRATNLTKCPSEDFKVEVDGTNVAVKLPRMLFEETDYFITMPVPKMHVMTKVSLGFKNQWGCLPDVKRLRNHPDFAHKVIAINKIIKPKLAIFDGTYFLNRTGPIDGIPVKMDLIIAGDVGATTLVCCELMEIDPFRVKHLSLAIREGIMPEYIGAVQTNQVCLDRLKKEKFYLKRTLKNWATLFVFQSNLLTRIAYDSRCAKPIHDILYFIEGKRKDFAPKW